MTYCGVGCSFDIWTKGRHILKVEPAHGAVNGVSTCVKGKFAWDFVNSFDRLTKPLIREGGAFREAEWDEALDLVGRRLGEIKGAHGPDALAFIASSKCTNEEAYLMQKLARAMIGTNNVDNCSRYCQTPATMGLFRTVGLANTEFLNRWVNGLEEYRKSLEPFTLAMASERTGLSAETIEKVARMVAEAESVCICWAMGVTQHTNGSDTSTAISNLLLVTATICAPVRARIH